MFHLCGRMGFCRVYICNLSQIYLDDEHFPTFSLTGSGNPSQMKYVAIFFLLSNSFLATVFGFFVVVYVVTTYCQMSNPCAPRNAFIFALQKALLCPLNCGTPILSYSMIFLPMIKLFSEGPTLIPIVGILRGG
jgi:hypothetical protein